MRSKTALLILPRDTPPRSGGLKAARPLQRGERAPAQSVAGVVLCGGKSSRMGRDKALVEVEGQKLLSHALALLDAVVLEVRIACGTHARYEEFGRELVLDRAADMGPLAGLAATLATSESELVLCVACDMPRVDETLLKELVDRSIAEGLDVCVLRSTRGVEPLCGVWRVSMLHSIEAALAAGELRVVAAFEVPLADGSRPRVGFVDVADQDRLFNVNTPADLESERSR